MQDPQQLHQDTDTRNLPSWYQKFRVGPLGPMGLCAIAMGFIALLISGRLRMLYPMPRTVVASPQAEPQPTTTPKPVEKPKFGPVNVLPGNLGKSGRGNQPEAGVPGASGTDAGPQFETSKPK